jgi:transcriptional regulator with XRE-family HTH domain
MGTFGEWLRGQRTAGKLTREEFAQRVGCSAAMLRKIEDGERRPSVQIAELIANCLDIPTEERGSFVKVARGELTSDHLARFGKPVSQSGPSQRSSLRSNLPVLPTPLIGREQELDELGRVLRTPSSRILTLVGPGGIGKTRLAVETASLCQNDFPDGVYFVSLAPVQTSRLIVPVIAQKDSYSTSLRKSSSCSSLIISSIYWATPVFQTFFLSWSHKRPWLSCLLRRANRLDCTLRQSMRCTACPFLKVRMERAHRLNFSCSVPAARMSVSTPPRMTILPS